MGALRDLTRIFVDIAIIIFIFNTLESQEKRINQLEHKLKRIGEIISEASLRGGSQSQEKHNSEET